MTCQSGIHWESLSRFKVGFICPTMGRRLDYGPTYACATPFVSVVRQLDTQRALLQTGV
jgi:hypothetical protein